MLLLPSSYKQTFGLGYARSRATAAYPHLWDGLVAHYEMGLGPTGGTLFDHAGRRLDGTLTNMDPATDWVTTERGGALVLNSTTAHVSLGANVFLHAGGPFTLSWWEQVTSDSNSFPSRFCLDVGGSALYFLCVRGKSTTNYGALTFGRSPNTLLSIRASLAPSGAASVGIWRHWVIAGKDPVSTTVADWRCYCDGIEQALIQGSTFATVATNRIGYDGSDNGADCKFGSVTIHSRILPSDEIQQLYLGASPLTLRPTRRAWVQVGGAGATVNASGAEALGETGSVTAGAGATVAPSGSEGTAESGSCTVSAGASCAPGGSEAAGETGNVSVTAGAVVTISGSEVLAETGTVTVSTDGSITVEAIGSEVRAESGTVAVSVVLMSVSGPVSAEWTRNALEAVWQRNELAARFV